MDASTSSSVPSQFSFEVLCEDRASARRVVQEFEHAPRGDHVTNIDVSAPRTELGITESLEIVAIVVSFVTGVVSQVAASWIYDRLSKSAKNPTIIIIRHDDTQITVSNAREIETALRSATLESKPSNKQDA